MLNDEEKPFVAQGTTLEKAQTVLDRLQKTYADQGLRLSLDRLDGATLWLNVERFAEGAPTAFMIKALGGTYRRYVPEIKDVGITKFTTTLKERKQSAETAEKPMFQFKGLPELDLTTAVEPRQITLALENFSALVQRHQLHKFRVSWKNNRLAASILERWCQSEDACCHQQDKNPSIYIVHVPAISLEGHDFSCGLNEKGEVLPAGILLTMPLTSKDKEANQKSAEAESAK